MKILILVVLIGSALCSPLKLNVRSRLTRSNSKYFGFDLNPQAILQFLPQIPNELTGTEIAILLIQQAIIELDSANSLPANFESFYAPIINDAFGVLVSQGTKGLNFGQLKPLIYDAAAHAPSLIALFDQYAFPNCDESILQLVAQINDNTSIHQLILAASDELFANINSLPINNQAAFKSKWYDAVNRLSQSSDKVNVGDLKALLAYVDF